MLPGLLHLFLAATPAQAAPARTPAFDPIVFEPVKGSGIDFVTNSGRTAHRHQPETMVAGVALFDFDNDGRLDVFLTNGAKMPSLDKSEPAYWNRLYRNLGGWKFEDVTERAGVKGHGYDNGAATGDYDNDGFVDLFVAGLRENVLYRNRGDGTFEDVTAAAGLKNPDPDYGTLWAVAGAFLDYDQDGDLDLFVSNYVVWDPKTEPICGPKGIPDYCHPNNYKGLPHSLYRNEGNGRFTDVSESSGVTKAFGGGLGIGVGDYNADGWLDVYVANDAMANQLWINQKDGTFADDGPLSGAALNAAGNPEGSMGVARGDYDRDGDEDLFISNIIAETFAFYVNDGAGGFEDRRVAADR